MNFGYDRRYFLKSTAALSVLTQISSFASESPFVSHSKVSLYFLNDAVILRQLSYPFSSQKLLCHGESLAPGVFYGPGDLFCPLEHLNHGSVSYFLMASPQCDSYCYRIFEVEHSNFIEPRRSLVAELAPHETDQNDRLILNSHTNLYLVTCIHKKLHLFLFDSQTFQMNIVAVENDGTFKRLNSVTLDLPHRFSIHMIPKEIFSGLDNVFLLIKEEEKSQKFLQLDLDADSGPEWKTLASLDHGSILHDEWQYEFSSLMSLSGCSRGDQYFMIFQYDRSSSHAFLFLRSDNKLAALTFEENKEGFCPVVLGISQKQYFPKDTHFYSTCHDNTLQKDIILCRDNATETPFLLSLEKNSFGAYDFVETPLDLTVDDDEVQGYLNCFFSSQAAEKNSFLLPSQSAQNGVSFCLYVTEDDEEEHAQFPINLYKKDDTFRMRLMPNSSALLQSHASHLVDSTLAFFQRAYGWSKKNLCIPYCVLGFLGLAGIFRVVALKFRKPVVMPSPADDLKIPINNSLSGAVLGAETHSQQHVIQENYTKELLEQINNYEMLGFHQQDISPLEMWIASSLEYPLGKNVYLSVENGQGEEHHNFQEIVQTLHQFLTGDGDFQIYQSVESNTGKDPDGESRDESFDSILQNLRNGWVSTALFVGHREQFENSKILKGMVQFPGPDSAGVPLASYSMKDVLVSFIMNGAVKNISAAILQVKLSYEAPKMTNPNTLDSFRSAWISDCVQKAVVEASLKRLPSHDQFATRDIVSTQLQKEGIEVRLRGQLGAVYIEPYLTQVTFE